MKKAVAIFALWFLTGCTNPQMAYIKETYWHITPTRTQMPDDNYKVYDRPSDGLVMIEASTETSIKLGMWAGLGGTPTPAPRPRYEAAARKFLADSGRSHCAIVDGYPLATVHFEFRYTCADKAPAR